jgi:hypothetical protein
MITLLTDRGDEVELAGAEAAGDALWLSPTDAEAATGFALEAEGPCRDGLCVPLPPDRAAQLVRGGRLDVAGLWRHLGKPVARSARGEVWVLGESARERGAALRSLHAPDFSLPDPSGRLHRLSDHRGKKILLVTWASW